MTAVGPFELLRDLQRRFFTAGENITDLQLLGELVGEYGVSDFGLRIRDDALKEKLRFQFENAGAFGTNALPSLLVEEASNMRLLAGGYVDAEMIETLIGSRAVQDSPGS